MRILSLVQSLDLPDSWVAAGFIRNAVWDHLHGRSPTPPGGHVDVIWFIPVHIDPAEDLRQEGRLRPSQATGSPLCGPVSMRKTGCRNGRGFSWLESDFRDGTHDIAGPY